MCLTIFVGNDASEELREEMNSKLKEKELEVERERRNVKEMMEKLASLQSDIAGAAVGIGGPVEMSEEEKEAAEKKKAEAKARAQRRREKREKLKQKLLKMKEEKQALEDQLMSNNAGSTVDEYMNQMALGTPSDISVATAAATEATLNEAQANFARLEKKLKKKIRALLTEIDDMKDESRFEKNQLMETISEQAKDIKLFEQICHAVMNEKELKHATERAQWSEEANEWLLPVIKQRDLKVGKVDRSGGGGNQLPSIPSSSSSGANYNDDVMLPGISRNKHGSAGNMGYGEISGSKNRREPSRSAGGIDQYNLDDRIEYQPSMAQVTDFSSLVAQNVPTPSPPPELEKKKTKSARAPKLKKNKEVATQKFEEADSDKDYANDNDFENEFEDDYAGPIADWGFLIPQGQQNEPEQTVHPGKENKRIKKKKPKKVHTDGEQEDIDTRNSQPSLPPI